MKYFFHSVFQDFDKLNLVELRDHSKIPCLEILDELERKYPLKPYLARDNKLLASRVSETKKSLCDTSLNIPPPRVSRIFFK